MKLKLAFALSILALILLAGCINTQDQNAPVSGTPGTTQGDGTTGQAKEPLEITKDNFALIPPGELAESQAENSNPSTANPITGSAILTGIMQSGLQQGGEEPKPDVNYTCTYTMRFFTLDAFQPAIDTNYNWRGCWLPAVRITNPEEQYGGYIATGDPSQEYKGRLSRVDYQFHTDVANSGTSGRFSIGTGPRNYSHWSYNLSGDATKEMLLEIDANAQKLDMVFDVFSFNRNATPSTTAFYASYASVLFPPFNEVANISTLQSSGNFTYSSAKGIFEEPRFLQGEEASENCQNNYCFLTAHDSNEFASFTSKPVFLDGNSIYKITFRVFTQSYIEDIDASGLPLVRLRLNTLPDYREAVTMFYKPSSEGESEESIYFQTGIDGQQAVLSFDLANITGGSALQLVGISGITLNKSISYDLTPPEIQIAYVVTTENQTRRLTATAVATDYESGIYKIGMNVFSPSNNEIIQNQPQECRGIIECTDRASIDADQDGNYQINAWARNGLDTWSEKVTTYVQP